jgi:hypothetical protein
MRFELTELGKAIFNFPFQRSITYLKLFEGAKLRNTLRSPKHRYKKLYSFNSGWQSPDVFVVCSPKNMIFATQNLQTDDVPV